MTSTRNHSTRSISSSEEVSWKIFSSFSLPVLSAHELNFLLLLSCPNYSRYTATRRLCGISTRLLYVSLLNFSCQSGEDFENPCHKFYIFHTFQKVRRTKIIDRFFFLLFFLVSLLSLIKYASINTPRMIREKRKKNKREQQQNKNLFFSSFFALLFFFYSNNNISTVVDCAKSQIMILILILMYIWSFCLLIFHVFTYVSLPYYPRTKEKQFAFFAHLYSGGELKGEEETKEK